MILFHDSSYKYFSGNIYRAPISANIPFPFPKFFPLDRPAYDTVIKNKEKTAITKTVFLREYFLEQQKLTTLMLTASISKATRRFTSTFIYFSPFVQILSLFFYYTKYGRKKHRQSYKMMIVYVSLPYSPAHSFTVRSIYLFTG